MTRFHRPKKSPAPPPVAAVQEPVLPEAAPQIPVPDEDWTVAKALEVAKELLRLAQSRSRANSQVTNLMRTAVEDCNLSSIKLFFKI